MKLPNSSRVFSLLVLSAGFALTAATSGCLAVAVGAGAGAGAVAYVRGELEANLDKDVATTVRAASRAVEQLEFVKLKETKDATGGEIVARNVADKKITIVVERDSESVTKVKIRVGFMGDEQTSLLILDKIKAGL